MCVCAYIHDVCVHVFVHVPSGGGGGGGLIVACSKACVWVLNYMFCTFPICLNENSTTFLSCTVYTQHIRHTHSGSRQNSTMSLR